jgi:nicotinamide phosphoribosyltransferase
MTSEQLDLLNVFCGIELNPLLMTDGYKTSHHKMYPEGTTLVYSNFTPRNVNRMPLQAKDVVVFGTQYVMKYIIDLYKKNFFDKPKDVVCGQAKKYLSAYLSTDYDVSHFEALHDLGYLPIKVKSLKEGTIIGPNIPFLTIYNTKKEFYWLPNFLETLISSLLWKPLHSASMAYAYKKILLKNASLSDASNIMVVNFQGHDFSFRGMQHPESAISSGMGWLTSFWGTDTIPALQAANYYYLAENVGFSVPASEHAVMTAYGKENEIDGFRRLMKQYPSGYLSVVSDSFDLWQVVKPGGYLTQLKEEVLARDGRVVIRPDSGNPVDIICGVGFKEGDKYYKYESITIPPGETKVEITEAEYKGVIENLWEVFGGTVNEQLFKCLDPHIGCIYGDAITLDRLEQICERLKAKGFATTNVVLGVGSYSLGYATRDNQGGAVKATYVEIEMTAEEDMTSQGGPSIGEKFIVGREIFKDPVTDRGLKKSAKGLLQVYLNENGIPTLKDCCTWEEEDKGLLETIVVNGSFVTGNTMQDIRDRIENTLK